MEYDKGAGCLHAACYGGDHDTLKYLFEVAGVNPNPDSIDRTPMLIALSINVSIIKYHQYRNQFWILFLSMGLHMRSKMSAL